MSRKRVTMTVTVTVPRWMTAAQARREVRTLINDQANYMWEGWVGGKYHEVDEKTVRCRKVSAAPHA